MMAVFVGKRLQRSKSGLKVVPIKESDRSPFELQEPEWIPDSSSLKCMHCDEHFDFIRRRHHCRRCGKLYCASCTERKLVLPRMCFLDPVRLCPPCTEKTLAENVFFDIDIKHLINGSILLASGNSLPEIETDLMQCRLSPDYQHLLVSGSNVLKIPMKKINKAEHERPNSLNLNYTKPDGKEDGLKLESPPDAPANAAIFLGALEKACRMSQEAKSVIGTGD